MSSCARLLVITLFLFSSGDAPAEEIEGTKVSMEMPPGFTKAADFPGYTLDEKGASIAVIEVPGPFSEVSKAAYAKEAALSRGIELIRQSKIVVDGRDAVLVEAKQSALGTVYSKLLLVFGDETGSVMIAASFPSDETDLREPVRKALLSAKWDKGRTIDVSSGLTFKVEEKDPFKISKVRVANSILLAPGGHVPAKSKSDPMIIVASSTEFIPAAYKKYISRFFLNKIETLKDIKIFEEIKVTIDNLPGTSVKATAKDRDLKEDRFVYQIILFADNINYYLLATCSLKEGHRYENIFRDIFYSFKQM